MLQGCHTAVMSMIYPRSMEKRDALFAAIAAAFSAACTAPWAPDAPAPTDEPWIFDADAPALRAVSCPEGETYQRPEAFTVTATPLDLSAISSDLSISGWALSSDHADFGGLSGAAITPSGNLLTVSDAGRFVWLTMESGAPTGEAHIAYMLGPDGEPLAGAGQRSRRADAEGLALKDGLAIVSFEHDHRILAFDLEGCGASALGAELATVANRPASMGRAMRDNGGLEGVSLLADGQLAAVIETRDPAIPYGRVRKGGGFAVDAQVRTFAAQSGTGVDVVGDRLYTVHRDFRPGDGNYITVSVTALSDGVPSGPATPLLTLDPSGPVDNFEAIVVATDPETGAPRRLYILSDDNFNDRQRTLLFAIDLN